MTVVVADSSPLNYLTLIESVDLLRQLYGRILIPREVADELTHPGALPRVREWALRFPAWVEVRQIPQPDEPALLHLDAGERAAIILAQHERALLLIDDALGRREASRRGIQNTGTLGVLRAAAQKDLVDLSVWAIAIPRSRHCFKRSVDVTPGCSSSKPNGSRRGARRPAMGRRAAAHEPRELILRSLFTETEELEYRYGDSNPGLMAENHPS